MASLDFEKEKLVFESYYDSNKELFKKWFVETASDSIRFRDWEPNRRPKGLIKERLQRSAPASNEHCHLGLVDLAPGDR